MQAFSSLIQKLSAKKKKAIMEFIYIKIKPIKILYIKVNQIRR